MDQVITCNFVPQSLDGATEELLGRPEDGQIDEITKHPGCPPRSRD